MLFTSGKYGLFLAIVFFAYWLLASKRRVPVIFLLAVSYYFYALWNAKFLVLLVLISASDFLIALAIKATESKRRRKILLAASLVVDIGVLVTFKYFNFFSSSFAELLTKLGHPTSPIVLSLVLPLGLSFVTFRSLSYVIDVYRGTMEPTKRPIDYLAFVAFFPTVIAGPLVRAKQLLPQFQERPQLSSDEGCRAIFLILIGLIKKIAIADFLGNNLVDRVWDQPQLYSSLETLAAIYGYALQIYCDFSGYTDIAIGSALLLGFKLPQNFNSPYRARDLRDFWKRWHMTLSSWLFDYVYISLGGLRKRRINLYRNLVITFLIGGLWHGAAWTFVVWGALHGIGLSVNHGWEQLRKRWKLKPRRTWWSNALSVLLTFHFVCLTWVVFRSESLAQVWEVLKRLGSMQFAVSNLATPVLMVLVIGYLAHWFPKSALEKIGGGWSWLPSPVQAAIILLVALGLYYVSGAEAQFIYGNF
jgi:D-alanyl-lipoteichoic acid acyltransferase DltB (MBOAT superfamily)